MPSKRSSRKRLRCGGFCFGSCADGRERKPLPYNRVILTSLISIILRYVRMLIFGSILNAPLQHRKRILFPIKINSATAELFLFSSLFSLLSSLTSGTLSSAALFSFSICKLQQGVFFVWNLLSYYLFKQIGGRPMVAPTIMVSVNAWVSIIFRYVHVLI